MKLVNNTDIDYQKWDELIYNSPQGNIYGTSWYLDIVSPGWKAFLADDYSLAMPVPTIKKWGVPLVRQPYFCQQLGIFSLTNTPKNLLKTNLALLKKKYFEIIYSGNVGNLLDDKSINDIPGLVLKPTYHLNLEESYDGIFSRYNQNRKRDLNKAKKRGLQLHESEDVEMLVAIYKEQKGISKNKEYERFIQLFKAASARKMATLLYAIHPESGIHSGALFWEYKNQLTYIFGGTTELGKKSGANTFVFNSVIEKHSRLKRVLDFEGSSIESISVFYKSFGANPCYYPVIKSKLF